MRFSRSGYTLTEVLIVTAIAGVLASVGIPAYRQLSGRSKKIEAKVDLAKLYAAEQTFYGEYQAYGNNLYMLNYQLEGNRNYVYNAGFSQGGVCQPQTTLRPAIGSSQGQTITRKYPTYYTTTTAKGDPMYGKGVTIASNGYSNVCVTGLISAAAGKTFPYRLKSGFDASPYVNASSNVYSYPEPGTGVMGESNGFFATADGVLNGKNGVNSLNIDRDIWFIDHERTLVNIHDGLP